MSRNKSIYHNKNDVLLDTYVGLLRESQHFLSEKGHEHFLHSVFLYAKACKEYDFNNGRLEPIICYPILLNKAHNRAIVFVLKRIKDMSGGRVEYIHSISAKKEGGEWLFELRDGHTDSFSYANENYATLSDTEIGIKTVRNFLLYGYIKERASTNDSLFTKDIYVWR